MQYTHARTKVELHSVFANVHNSSIGLPQSSGRKCTLNNKLILELLLTTVGSIFIDLYRYEVVGVNGLHWSRLPSTENGPSATGGQCSLRSACTSLESDRDLRNPFTHFVIDALSCFVG